MAVGVSEFNETEPFEEYNPHPYKGGYDIVLTYGISYPPSPAICYPISDASDSPLRPQVPLPSAPVDPPALPETSGKAIPSTVGREDDLPETEYGSPYGYDERGFTAVDWWGNLSGFSPFMIMADGNGLGDCSNDAEDLRFWGQLRRAADYIFGYSQGFGERRIGVDSLGIPIYAYKRHGNNPIHVEIEPARIEKLDNHCDSLHHERLNSTYNNRDDENYRFNNFFHTYARHHSEELLHTEVDPVESVFSWKPSQRGLHEDQVPWSYNKSSEEASLDGEHGIDYNSHYYGGSQNVQMETVDSSYQILSYPEASRELSFTEPDWEPSYNGHENENNTFTSTYYEGWEHQQPRHLELEPYRPSWVQCPEYYGISEDINSFSQPISENSEVYHESSSPRSTWQSSSLGEWIHDAKFCNSEHAFTSQDEHSFELEPYKPTWVLNPNYYGTYEEISAPYKQ